MESIMLTVKFVLLLAMEIFVVATIVSALILGLYQVVKDKIRESRRLDEVAPETL
jgi:energy-converting hydrogenase Eha subunit A